MPRARAKFGPPARPTVSARKSKPNESRNVANDVLRLGQPIREIECRVEEAPPIFSASTVHGAEEAMHYVVKYILARDIQDGLISDVPLDEDSSDFQRALKDRKSQLRQRRQRPVEFDSFQFWVTLIHTRQIYGNGYISRGKSRVAHNNLGSTSSLGTMWHRRQVGSVQNKSTAAASTSAATIEEDQQHDLESDEQQTVMGLPAPPTGAHPLSLQSALSFLCWCASGVRWYGHGTIDRNVYSKTQKLLRYIAGTLGWYPTARLEKTWLTDEQLQSLLAGFWRPRKYTTAIQISCHQLLALCLTHVGFRQLAWLDNQYRAVDSAGVYARWGHIKIHFLGYGAETAVDGTANAKNAGEAEFLVTGTTNPTKHFVKHGDAQHSHFQFGTRADTDLTEMDIACAFVVHAVISGAFPDSLLDVIESHSCGQALLNGRDKFIFSCKPECVTAPIFVTQRQKRLATETTDNLVPLKHELDAATPKIGSLFRPMNQLDFNRALRLAGEAIGLESVPGTAVFRRTYSLKMQLAKRPGASIATNMQHYGGSERLHRAVYVPTNQPVDTTADIARPDTHTTSTSVQSAIDTIGSIRYRPSAEKLLSDQIDELEAKLATYLDIVGQIDDVEDERDNNESILPTEPIDTDREAAAAADLISTLAKSTGIDPPPIQMAIKMISKLINEPRDGMGRALLYDEHPWQSLCGGKMFNVITYCLAENVSRVCRSCLGEPHTEYKGVASPTSQQARDANECYMQCHGVSLCFCCWKLFDLDKIEEHVQECVQLRLETTLAASANILTADGRFCSVTGPNRGPQAWEQAQFYLCPFKTCIDPDMRHRRFTDDTEHFSSIGLQHHRLQWWPMTGYNHFPTSGTSKEFSYHLVSHIFDQTKTECIPRMAILKKKIVCGIFACSVSFEKSDDGFINYVCHLVNDHHLPVTVGSEGRYANILPQVQPEDFGGRLPVCRRHDPNHPDGRQNKSLAAAGQTETMELEASTSAAAAIRTRAYAFAGVNASQRDVRRQPMSFTKIVSGSGGKRAGKKRKAVYQQLEDSSDDSTSSKTFVPRRQKHKRAPNSSRPALRDVSNRNEYDDESDSDFVPS